MKTHEHRLLSVSKDELTKWFKKEYNINDDVYFNVKSYYPTDESILVVTYGDYDEEMVDDIHEDFSYRLCKEFNAGAILWVSKDSNDDDIAFVCE